MYEIWRALLSSDQFMPHSHCYLNNKWLILINYFTDLIIGAAYVSISLTLVLLVRRVRLPFHWMFLAFGAFIGACGGTHFMEVVTLYTPYYWLASVVKIITAAASVATGICLPFLIPHVDRLFEEARRSEQRKYSLQEANLQLEEMYARVRELDQMKTRFFENISHELRTPLSLLVGPLQKLSKAGNLSSEQRKELRVCERSGRMLLKHVNDILELSKIDSSAMVAHKEVFDLGAMVRRTVDYFHSSADNRGVRLEVDAGTTPLLADADKMERVVVNLLSNAVKFVGDGGTVACHVRAEGDSVLLEVEDDGPGIPAALREAVFERFRQVDDGPGKTAAGTGLGLAIVKEFVELHDGSVTLVPSDKGAHFRVVLPRGDLDAAEAPAPGDEAYARQALAELEASQVVDESVTGPADKPLLLLVEDNPELADMMRATLLEDYRVVLATRGQTAYERALSLDPDGIVSDVMMPEMSGEELLELLRGHADLQEIPVLMCTALADEGTRVRLLEKGAQDYLIKPFAPAELRARVHNMVSASVTRKQLQRSLRELRDAYEHRSRFTATVSHELRTPLNSVIGFSEVLLASDAHQTLGDNRRSLEFIHAAGTELLRHIDDLLDLARLESGRFELQVDEIDVLDEARSAVEALRPVSTRAGIEVEVEGEPLRVDADRKRLRQILYNLLSNAVKFTPPGGRVAVRVHDRTLEVVDSGIGIAPADQERVFEAYEQVEPPGTGSPAGTGLGLAITRQLAAAHGWEIGVVSELGKGSRFWVRM